MIDNARALITTLSIICLHFVFRDFSFIFVMESEDKYKLFSAVPSDLEL
jgi:hypothetical protein